MDTHSLVDKGDNEGFVHVNTTSLTYGARAALGYHDDVGKRLYAPWYWDINPRGELMAVEITEDDLVDGRLPEELMQKVKESQPIPEEELLVVSREGAAANEK